LVEGDPRLDLALKIEGVDSAGTGKRDPPGIGREAGIDDGIFARVKVGERLAGAVNP
jgi:hypothetical protein